jgi:hypothetical protein
MEDTSDAEAQAAEWEDHKARLDEDRPSSRKLFL